MKFLISLYFSAIKIYVYFNNLKTSQTEQYSLEHILNTVIMLN